MGDEHVTEDDLLAELVALVSRPEREPGWYTAKEIAAAAGLSRDKVYSYLSKSNDVQIRKMLIDSKWTMVYRMVGKQEKLTG